MLITTLRNRNFRNFFLADIVSGFGAGLSLMGSNWFILQQTGTNKAVGIFFAICIAGGLLLFPFAGPIADRFDRRRVMMLSNMIRGVVVALVAAMLLLGIFHVALIYILAILSGMGWALQIPTSRGLVQELLTKEEYVHGSSLIEISLQVGTFFAAAASGFLYHAFGYTMILIINAITFFGSTLFLKKITYQRMSASDRSQGFFEQFLNGKNFLLKNRHLFVFGIVMFLPFVATMTLNVVLPGYVSQHLHSNAVVYGIADMWYGIGACLSGFIAAKLAERFNPFTMILFFFVLSVASLLYLTTNAMIVTLYAAVFCVGLGNSSLRVLMNAQLMHIVPTTYMGRCQSVWLSIAMLLQIISTYGMGRFIDVVPTPFGFLLLAAIMLMGLVGTVWLFPKLSNKLLIHVE